MMNVGHVCEWSADSSERAGENKKDRHVNLDVN